MAKAATATKAAKAAKVTTVTTGVQEVLALQGGGALGSYQAGVFEALSRSGVQPDWVAGISIGAINAAIIAGNPPERRVERLAEFWALVTSGLPWVLPAPGPGMRRDLTTIAAAVGVKPGKALTALGSGVARHWSEFATAVAIFQGAPGFFKPKWSPALPWLKGHVSYYDTTPLRDTLNRLVDWDRLNDGGMRVSLGAVGVMSGALRYFDTTRERLGAAHVMAASAYPPGLPPVEVDGVMWWDGGEASNTPLEYVLENDLNSDMRVYQIDLFPARGAMPETILEVEARAQDIRFASRAQHGTDNRLALDAARLAFARLVAELPAELRDSDEVRAMAKVARQGRVAIAQLVYSDRLHQGAAKYVDFSRVSMQAHWAAGRADAAQMLADKRWAGQPMAAGAVVHETGRGTAPAAPARKR